MFLIILNYYSHWIIIWFLLFMTGIIKANPFLLLLIAFFVSLSFIYYLYTNNFINYNYYRLIFFIFLFKFFPLIIIIYYNLVSITENDIIATIALTMSYLIFLKLNNKNFIDIYSNMIKNIINNKNTNSIINKTYDYFYLKIFNNSQIFN